MQWGEIKPGRDIGSSGVGNEVRNRVPEGRQEWRQRIVSLEQKRGRACRGSEQGFTPERLACQGKNSELRRQCHGPCLSRGVTCSCNRIPLAAVLSTDRGGKGVSREAIADASDTGARIV